MCVRSPIPALQMHIASPPAGQVRVLFETKHCSARKRFVSQPQQHSPAAMKSACRASACKLQGDVSPGIAQHVMRAVFQPWPTPRAPCAPAPTCDHHGHVRDVVCVEQAVAVVARGSAQLEGAGGALQRTQQLAGEDNAWGRGEVSCQHSLCWLPLQQVVMCVMCHPLQPACAWHLCAQTSQIIPRCLAIVAG